MLRSLSSAVAGLKTHQTKMDVIGNNIANVNTYGFKSSRVTFQDVYYQTLTSSADATGSSGGLNPAQIGYGSTVGAIQVINTRGGFGSTSKSTDCYIGGEGYFVIQDANGGEYLTRVGSMDFDGKGNLVDPNGNYICGYAVDSISGQVSIGNTTIDLGQGNGDAFNGYTVTIKYASMADTADTAISVNDAAKTLTITYTPSADSPELTNAALQTALQTGTWTNAPAGFDQTAVTVKEAQTAGNAKVAETSGLIDNVANFDYTKTPQKLTNTYGQLINIATGANGVISGQTKTGEIVVIGRLALANVPNPQALTQVGDSYYQAVSNTGTITYAAPGMDNMGALQTSGLEMSNVDLANEMTDMITTQRGYQASSKIITVSDEMLETLVNLKR